jgi:hypothetical protein
MPDVIIKRDLTCYLTHTHTQTHTHTHTLSSAHTCSVTNIHAHTCLLTHNYTCLYMLTLSHTRSYMLSYRHTCSYMLTYTQIHMFIHAHTYTLLHSYTYWHTYILTHKHKYTCSYTLTHVYTLLHIYIHKHSLTHICSHIYPHTDTHTHTHTWSPPRASSQWAVQPRGTSFLHRTTHFIAGQIQCLLCWPRSSLPLTSTVHSSVIWLSSRSLPSSRRVPLGTLLKWDREHHCTHRTVQEPSDVDLSWSPGPDFPAWQLKSLRPDFHHGYKNCINTKTTENWCSCEQWIKSVSQVLYDGQAQYKTYLWTAN